MAKIKTIDEMREHFKPNERATAVSPLYLVWKKLYLLALQSSSIEEFFAKARALPAEENPADHYWRNVFLENVQSDETTE